MARKTLNYIADSLASLDDLKKKLQEVLQLKEQLSGSGMGMEAQVVGGGVNTTPNYQQTGNVYQFNPSGASSSPINLPPDPDPIHPAIQSNSGSPFRPQPMSEAFAPYTPQQRTALELGMPLGQGWSTHSDLSHARIAELTLGSSKHQSQITGFVEKLGGEGASGIDMETARKLEETNRQWIDLSQKVRQLSDSLVGLDASSSEYQRAIRQLTEATKNEAQARERLTQLEEESAEIIRSGGGGTGGGGGGGTPWYQRAGVQNAATAAQVIGQGLMAGGQMYGAYGSVYQAGMGADLGSELRIAQRAAGTEAITTSRYFGAMDLTRGENVIRHFGDFATGSDRYSFLGVQGGERARDLADELAEREYRYSRSGLGFQTGSMGLGMAGSALSLPMSVIGGAAMGAGIGSMIGGIGAVPAAVIGGTLGLMNGLTSMSSRAAGYGQAYASNPYAMSQGGLADTGIGSLMYGDQSAGMANRASAMYWSGRGLQTEQYVEQLRDAEMQSRQAQEDVRGYNEMQAAVVARQSWASRVGGYATSGLPFTTQKQGTALRQIDRAVDDIKENQTNIARRKGFESFSNAYYKAGMSPTEEIEDFSVDNFVQSLLPSLNPFKLSPFPDTEGQKQSIVNAMGQIQRTSKTPQEQLALVTELNNQIQNRSSFGFNQFNSTLRGFANETLGSVQEGLEGAVYTTQASTIQRQNQANKMIEEIYEPHRRQAEFLGSMELSFSDWANKQNMATSMIMGGRASGALTTELVRMGRSGLGSDQQIAQNVMQLQGVAGRQDDLTQLKEVMAEAVSVGFNKSQMAQQFVQATTQLASSLRTTSTGTMAKELAFSASMLGLEGDASLLSLGEAQQAIGRLGQWTGQTQGITGQMKTYAAFGSGMDIAGGSGLATQMNIYQLQEAEQAAQSGKLTDPRTEMLIRAQARSRFGTSNLKDLTADQRQEIAQSIREVRRSTMTPIVASIDTLMGESGGFQSLIEEAQRAAQAGDEETYRSTMSEAMSYGAQTQAGSAAVGQFFMQEAGTGTLKSANVQKMLNDQINAGNSRFSDPANQARQSFINRLTAQMSGRFSSSANQTMVEEYFKRQGEAITVSGFNEEGQLQQRSISSMEDYQSLPDTMKAQVTNATLMRGMQSKVAASEQGYGTSIDNVSNNVLAGFQRVIMEAIVATQDRSSDDIMRIFKGLTPPWQ